MLSYTCSFSNTITMYFRDGNSFTIYFYEILKVDGTTYSTRVNKIKGSVHEF